MAGPNPFEEFTKRFSDLLAQSPLQDMEKNARALATQMFSKLDLVTREEFDVQAQVLAKTREKLEQLEARLNELEGK